MPAYFAPAACSIFIQRRVRRIVCEHFPRQSAVEVKNAWLMPAETLTRPRKSHTELSRQGVEWPLAGIIYPRDRVFVGRDPLSNKESAAIIYELRHYAQKRIKLPTQSGVRTRLSGPPGGRASALSGCRAGDRYVTHIPSGARKRTNFGQNRLPAALIAPAPTRCADGQKVAAAYPRYLSVFTGESP